MDTVSTLTACPAVMTESDVGASRGKHPVTIEALARNDPRLGVLMAPLSDKPHLYRAAVNLFRFEAFLSQRLDDRPPVCQVSSDNQPIDIGGKNRCWAGRLVLHIGEESN